MRTNAGRRTTDTFARRLKSTLGLGSEIYETIFEHAPDAILAVDSGGSILLANVEATSMFGYSEDEMSELVVEDLIPDAMRESHQLYRDEYFHRPRTRPMGTQPDLYGMKKNGSIFPVDIMLSPLKLGSRLLVISVIRDITTRVKEREERENLRGELTHALTRIDTLRGLIPICAWCRNVRDDHGYWSRLEEYFHDHSELDFTHGICPDCAARFAAREKMGKSNSSPVDLGRLVRETKSEKPRPDNNSDRGKDD